MTEMEREHLVSLKFKHIKVQVISGIFYNEQTDVVVNSTSALLQLKAGQGSRALLEAAGGDMQEELSAKYPKGIKFGEIAISGGYQLYCSLVYHCSLKAWSESDKNEAEEVLKKVVMTSLDAANKTNGVRSITFPALGRGHNKFDAKSLAKLMFQCIADFEDNLPQKPNMKDVRFVIYPGDKESIEAFIEEVKNRSRSVHTSIEYSTDIENIKVTLMNGSLGKQESDVVFNEVTEDLDLSKSPLFELAGTDLKDSLMKASPSGKMDYDRIITTGNAQLKNCKAVYHGTLPPFSKGSKEKCFKAIKSLVIQSLIKATDSGYTSISFPPLGVTLKNYQAEISAGALQEAIIEHISKDEDISSLKHIYIIIQHSDKNVFMVFKEILFPKSQGKLRFDRTLNAKMPGKAIAKKIERCSKQWFIRMYQNEIKTPSYWTHFPGGQRIRKLKVDPSFGSKGLFKLVDLDLKTMHAVRSLVESTWEEDKLSHGRDAVGLGDLRYNKLKVIGIKRVENLNLFEKYCNFRQQMFGKGINHSFLSPDKLKSKGQVLTTLKIDPHLTKDIYKEVNEHYVFHGTKEDALEIIEATGLDSRMAGPNAMFGQGVYAAESSTKADQYTDHRDSRDLKEKHMFLTRMCMGDICVVDKPLKMKRPPCKSCLHMVCSPECRNTQLFDSVLVDGQWIFREMIVYDHAQCYPEYLITYKRVQ